MNFDTYTSYFDLLLEQKVHTAPYDDHHYLHYTKMNQARQQRWLKSGVLNEQLRELILHIEQPQQWIYITEPWCGDAAHNLPFIQRLIQDNTAIDLQIVLRDTPPFLIDQYLTGTSRSIPKLIIRDEHGEDLLVWGPRPKHAQDLLHKLRADGIDPHEIKERLQQWYNTDKGMAFQKELLVGLSLVMAENDAAQDS